MTLDEILKKKKNCQKNQLLSIRLWVTVPCLKFVLNAVAIFTIENKTKLEKTQTGR